MKYIAVIMLALTAVSAAEYYFARFEEGFTYSACITFIYETPNHNSAYLVEIPAGEFLEIPGFTGDTFIADSCQWGWYEANYRLNDHEYSGFVSERDLALSHISLGSDTLLVFRLVGFDLENDVYNAEFSVITGGETICTLDHRLDWFHSWNSRSFNHYVSSLLLDSSGLTGVRNLISLYSGRETTMDRCQADLLVWTEDGQLIAGPQILGVSSGGPTTYWTEVILPSDSGGVVEQIILHILGQVHNTDTESWEFIIDDYEVYMWTGAEFERE